MGRFTDAVLKMATGLDQSRLDKMKNEGRSEPARHGARRSRSKHPASGKPRKSREEKEQNKKIKNRANAPAVKPTLPQPEIDIVFGGLDTCPLYGVVLPMGHGKTTLAQEEGWIDCDSLITPGTKRKLSQNAMRRLADGEEYENAMSELSSMMAKALQVLTPTKPAILLSHSVNLLKTCGIPCLAILTLEDSVFERNLRLRDDVERYAAHISKKHLEAAESENTPLIVVQDNEYMRSVIYQIADSLGVDLGAPRVLHPDIALPAHIGGTTASDLTELVNMHEQGRVSRAIVDYQINMQGLKAYRGYGFTMNDWACTAAHLVDSTSAGDSAIPSLDNWPLSLESIGKTFDMSQDVDSQALLAAHGGEDEAFTLGLLLHWKLYGLHNDTTGRLRLLYYVRRNKWDMVMRKVRQGVLGSGTFMGEPITLSERDILLSLHMLSSTSVSGLLAKWREDKMGYPASRPSTKLMSRYTDILPSLVVAVPEAQSPYEQVAWDILVQSNLQMMHECADGLKGTGKLRRKHVIAYLLGAQLSKAWEGEQGAHRIIRDAVKQVATNWFRVGKIRDEWFDLIGKVLDDECDASDSIAQMVVLMVKTSSCQNLSGAQWGVRVAEAVQRVIMVGWCGKELKQSVVLQHTENGVLPVVLGYDEAAYITELMKIGAPKYMTGVTGSGESVLATIAELADWSRSGVGLVLELVNAGTWLGRLSQREKIGLLSNWVTRKASTACVDEELLTTLLNRFCKTWLRRHYNARLLADLETMTMISRRDGGLGSNMVGVRGKVPLNTDGVWDGTSGIKIKNPMVTPRPRILDLEACKRVLVAPKLEPKWSAFSLSMCGALVSCFLMGGSRKDAELLCSTVEAVKACRVHPLANLPDWEASYPGSSLSDSVGDETIASGIRECIQKLDGMKM